MLAKVKSYKGLYDGRREKIERRKETKRLVLVLSHTRMGTIWNGVECDSAGLGCGNYCQ